MDLDDELCLCFHVTRRKVASFLRVERPERVAQLSDCGGAGTGCGWCRPFLERLFQQYLQHKSLDELELPDAATYAQDRVDYRREQDK